MNNDNNSEWDPASEVCTALIRLGTRMATHFDHYFEQDGLTQAQFRTLLALCESGEPEPISPSALASKLKIERASVTVLVSKLVERGLVERREGENRRTHLLALTASGGELLARFAPKATALAQESLAPLSLDQLISLRDGLRRVDAILSDDKFVNL